MAVEPVALSEERWEQLREAQYSLRQWERHRRPDDLARMPRGARGAGPDRPRFVTSRFERALADLVGGYEGGWALWMVGLMRLELAVGDARDIDRFRSHPEGAWNRLLVNVDDALRTGELAVDLELMLQADGDVKPEDERSRSVADLLLVRARELADARLNMAPDEWERFSPRSRSR